MDTSPPLRIGPRCVVSAGLLFAVLFLISRYSYLLFHTVIEVSSITVACGVFLIAWNARRYIDNNYLLVIGIALLFVSGLDLLHTLSFEGMNVFPGFDADLRRQLGVAASAMEGLSFVYAAFSINRRVRAEDVATGYAAITALVLLSIFLWGVFPACYLPGSGPTTFLLAAEIAVLLVFIAAGLLLLGRRQHFEREPLSFLAGSIAATVVSELLFDLFPKRGSIGDLAGHFAKISAFYLLYKAMIEAALRKPYGILFRNLQRSEAALTRKTEELERSNRDLEQFASIVSHDLKDPLVTIGGFAELVADRYRDRLDEKGNDFLDRIVAGTFRMERMITSLLDYSRVTTRGRSFGAVRMEEVVAKARENLGHVLEECGCVIETEGLGAVIGDEAQLIQLVQNLIANAVKYRDEAPLRIRISGRRIEPGDLGPERTPLAAGQLFSVEDNGIGIDAAHHQKIFRIFHRAHGDRGEPGTGVGLAVCKRIVERHGGAIWVVSEPGKGSTFYFTLP